MGSSITKNRAWVPRMTLPQFEHCALGTDHWIDVDANVENQQWTTISIHTPKKDEHRIIDGFGEGRLYVKTGGKLEACERAEWLRLMREINEHRGSRRKKRIDKRKMKAAEKNPDRYPEWEDVMSDRCDEPGIQKFLHTMLPPDADYLTEICSSDSRMAGSALEHLEAWASSSTELWEAQTGRPVVGCALHLNSRVPHLDILSCVTDENGYALQGIGKGPGLVGLDNAGHVRQALSGIVPDDCGSVLRALRARRKIRYGAKLHNGYVRKGRNREPIDILMNWTTDRWFKSVFGCKRHDEFRLDYAKNFKFRVGSGLINDINCRLKELAVWQPEAYPYKEIPNKLVPEYNMPKLGIKSPAGTVGFGGFSPVPKMGGILPMFMGPFALLTETLDNLENTFTDL